MNEKWQVVTQVLSGAVLFCATLCLQTPLTAQGTSTAADGPDAEVKEFRMDDLGATLRTIPPGPERDYFAGVLANRANRLVQSIELLNRALPTIRAARPDRAAIALEALADDYNKSFRYADAAQAYDDLLTHFSNQLDDKHLQGTKDDSGIAHILRKAPPQTIFSGGSTRLKTERNPLGSFSAELTVNGIREQWLLDTGANLSVVSRSFAQRLGLTFLPGVAQTTAGITGIENPLHVALLPALQIGGSALHNVVVMVMEDANLSVNLGKQTYQINGIIGYPVLQAFGAVTFFNNGGFEAGDKSRSRMSGARMYMKLLMPVIEGRVEGTNLTFSFDTGASGTNLSVRYYDRFRSQSAKWQKGETKNSGAGGIVTQTTYFQPRLDLLIGNRTVTLDRVAIFPSKVGAEVDDLYGNLGQDVVEKFDSFTLDFSAMTFSLGDPLPAHAAH